MERTEAGAGWKQARGGEALLNSLTANSISNLGWWWWWWIDFTEINWGRPAFVGFLGQSLSQLIESETKDRCLLPMTLAVQIEKSGGYPTSVQWRVRTRHGSSMGFCGMT